METKPAKLLDASTLRMVFVGDIMLDNGPGHAISNGKDPFTGCSKLLLEADFTIGNLECVVGTGGAQRLKPYVFRAAENSELLLKKYFDGVSLANNHIFDCGEEGVRGSIAALERAGVPYFGAGHTLEHARRPLVLECKGHKIALLGYNELYADDYAASDSSAGNAPLHDHMILEDISNAKHKLGCDIVILFMHWGEELIPTPRDDQRGMAKRWIDSGATAVIGAHPHVVQTIDLYRGAPIVYSLGNFVFDYYPTDPPEWIGWVLTLEISAGHQVAFTTTPVRLDASGLPNPIDQVYTATEP